MSAGTPIERSTSGSGPQLLGVEEINRLLMEKAPLCLHQIDMEGNLVSMNPAGLAMLDVPNEEAILGVSYVSMVGERDQERIESLLQAAYRGTASRFEFTAVNDRAYSSSFSPISNDNGDSFVLFSDFVGSNGNLLFGGIVEYCFRLFA